MKKIILILISLILMLGLVGGVSAETLDVCQDGCTYSIIASAIDAAGLNDIVEVQDSETYDEGILINNKTNLIVRAAAGQTPKINSPVQGIQLMYCTDVTVEGFDVTSVDHGLRLFCDVFDSTIRNNYIHDIGSELFQTGSSWDHSTGCPRSKFETAGYNTVTGNLIENNRFENANGRAMEFYTGSNNIIRGNKFHYSDDFIFWEYFGNPPHVFDNIVENNTFYGFGDGDGTGYNTHGVKLDGTHQIVRYNIIFDNDRYGISIGGDNHEIYHNTIVHNGGYNNYINSVSGSNDAGGIAVYYDSNNIIVRDNIVVNAMDYGLLKRSSSKTCTGCTWDNNLVYNVLNLSGELIVQTNPLSGDPLFTDYVPTELGAPNTGVYSDTIWEFTPQYGSPACGTGIASDGEDFVGALACPEPPSEVWVDDGGDCGENSPCYTNIQDAIDAVAEEGTVNVAAGTYYPSNMGGEDWNRIMIDKSLTLKGEGSSLTILDENHEAGVHTTLLWITASDVNVEGFTIQNSDFGVRVNGLGEDQTNINFNDAIVTGNYGSGFVFDGEDAVSGVTFTDCEANDNGNRGIYFAPAKTAQDVTLTDTNASNNQIIGFNTQGTMQDLTIFGGEFNNNEGGNPFGTTEGPYFGFGISLENCVNCIINSVVANSNGLNGPTEITYGEGPEEVSGGAGVVIKEDSENVDVLNSEIKDNTNGLLIEYWTHWATAEPTNLEAHYNNIENNKYYGFLNWGPTQTVDAQNNWWGTATGPNTAGADNVSSNVDFAPYYTDAGMATLSTEYSVCASGCNYVKIQDAVDAASAGDTIIVSPGTYSASTNGEIFPIIIDKSLTLKGVQFGVVPGVDGTRAGDESFIDVTTQNYVFDISADSVTIDGFKIKTYPTAPVNGPAWMIPYYGVTVYQGIIAVNLTDLHINNNIIDTSPTHAYSHGVVIFLANIDNSEIKNNYIERITTLCDGFPLIMLIDGCENNIIESNSIDGSDWHGIGSYGDYNGKDGLSVDSGNTIKNNIVKNCANAGIGLAYGTKDNTVEGNTLDGNTYANIDLWMAGAGNIITDNTCKNAVNFYGISIKETSNTTIQNNNLTLNDIGVYIYSGTSENNEVHYNNIYGNTGYGAKNDDATSTLDTEKNYWGAVNPNFDNIISGSVDYFPWSTNEECTDFTNDDLITIVVDNGWTGYSNYQEVEVGGTNYYYNHNAFSTIQGGIDAVAESGTVNVAAGTYEEEITIDKSLTLRGATYNINKNDYNIPVDYAWDDSVESIIQPPEGFEDYDVVTIDDADDVTVEGFIIQALQRSSSGSRMLVHVYVDDENMENLNIINNVIGPNTNTESQDGSKGRMNIDLDINPYDASMGLTNSLISGNKIFGSEGNGNALFIWASYYAYGATGPSPMTGTIIEDNEICCGHRSGIETAGGFTGLTIRNNKIHNFSGLPEDDPDKLKYGHGILLIRGSGDKLADASSAYGPEDLTIENNEIYNNEKSGIYMGPINKDYTITGNDIYDNGWDGIMLDMDGQYWNPTFEPEPIAFQHAVYDGSENVVANENKIYNNGQKGVNVMGTPTNEFEFDAENNYWGTADGPGGEGSGTGDAVSGNVDYPPWYIDSAMTMLLDHNLQENQTLADNASLTVDENITDIVVPIGSPIQEINVPSTVTEDKEVSLDLSLLLNSSKDVSLINNLTLKREGTVANYTAAIPEGTIITGDSNWSGSIILPTVKNNANYTAPSGLVDVVIDIGSGSEINFSKAVKIIIGGRAGKKAAWSRGTTLTEITTVCDNVTNPTNIYPDKAPRECYIDDGSDLVIWTYHFTKFAAYTPASTTPPTGGGGGGGGRSRIVTPVVPVPEEEETAPEEEVKETPKEEAVTETTPEETPSDSAEATEHPKRRGFGEITGAFIGTITGRASIGSLIVIIIVVGGLLLFSRFYGGMPGADHFTRASNFHKRAEKAHTKSEYTKSEKLYKKAQILREEGEKIIFRKG